MWERSDIISNMGGVDATTTMVHSKADGFDLFCGIF